MDDILEDYKLRLPSTQIMFSTHPTQEFPVLVSVRLQSRDKWYPKQELGAGAFGTVRLQATDKREQRAVKAIRKTPAVKYGVDHGRELAALAVFLRAKVT